MITEEEIKKEKKHLELVNKKDRIDEIMNKILGDN